MTQNDNNLNIYNLQVYKYILVYWEALTDNMLSLVTEV